MRILITNDDGIGAEGIRVLARSASKLGEVKVVAPHVERSACSHAMTLRDPVRAKRVDFVEGIEAWEANGLPADCVNVGLRVAWPDGCDLVLSGINHGPNLGFDISYSGTVGGATEAVMLGIPGIAISMACFVDGAPLHFETGEQWLEENLAALLEVPPKPLTLLNINIPAIAYPELRGTRVVAMGQRVYENRLEERQDPWGRQYFWQGGVVVMFGEQPGTDVEAVNQGFVAITPVSLDWTDREYAAILQDALARPALA